MKKTVLFCSVLLLSFLTILTVQAQQRSKVSNAFDALNQVSSQRTTGPESSLGEYLIIRDGLVKIEALPASDASTLRADLASLGGKDFGNQERFVTGSFPVERLNDLETLASLRYVRPIYKPHLQVGAVTSQGDEAQVSDLLKSSRGIDGSGIKVGILSDSYDNSFLYDGPGASEAAGIASGDLPGATNPNGYTSPVKILKDLPGIGGGIDEGRAMAEIVHDVAPGAELSFYTAFDGQQDFADGIIALADDGAEVIVDDVIYFAEPFFQDGVIAQAVNEVNSQGVSYFSSAGNGAEESYEDVFRPGFFDGVYMFHDFDPGAGLDIFQEVLIEPGGNFLPSFQWDESFFTSCPTCPGSTNDLDIFIFLAEDFSSFFTGSFGINVGGDPFEILNITLGSAAPGPVPVYFAIAKYTPDGGPDPGKIKYVNYGSRSVPTEWDTKSGTVVGHANTMGANAVAASRYDNPLNPEAFSSTGGVPILFDVEGNRISPNVMLKPDYTGPQGANTTFFFPGFDYESDGFPNFFGTSASAPHAAGLAALLLEGTLSRIDNDQIRSSLINTAIDMDNPNTPGFDTGYDFKTGAGFIQADAAYQEALSYLDNKCFGTEVVNFVQGPTKRGRKVSRIRSDPSRAEGRPRENKYFNFVALGLGGEITLKLDNAILDLPGNDFKVFESSFQKCKIYPEEAAVYASSDGENFVFLGNTCQSGKFDLAAGGLLFAEYIKVVDITDASKMGNTADGYDLDGIRCINEDPDERTVEESDDEVFTFVPDEDVTQFSFNAYPNPVSSEINLQLFAADDTSVEYKLYDPLGKLVYQEMGELKYGNQITTLDLSSIEKGMYFLSIETPLDKAQVVRLMKD